MREGWRVTPGIQCRIHGESGIGSDPGSLFESKRPERVRLNVQRMAARQYRLLGHDIAAIADLPQPAGLANRQRLRVLIGGGARIVDQFGGRKTSRKESIESQIGLVLKFPSIAFLSKKFLFRV